MERTRPNRAQQAEPEDIAAEPAGAPTLLELLEVLRGPAVMKSDVDAFQAALARPPEGDETPRQRADLLLSLIDDAQVRDYTGHLGRTVRAAAVQALMGLGYPYALEVPPDAIEQVPEAPSEGEEGVYHVPAGALALALITVLVQAVPSLPILYLIQNWNNHGGALLGLPLIGAVFLLVPPLTAVAGGALQVRWLQSLGTVLMALASVVWVGASLLGMAFLSALSLLFLIPGVLQMFSTAMLSRPWSRPPEPPGGTEAGQ